MDLSPISRRYKSPTLRGQMSFQDVNRLKQGEPSHNSMKVAKNNEGADNPKRIWYELSQNESIVVQKTKDEGVEGKSEANMEESFVQGDPTFRPQGNSIIRIRGRNSDEIQNYVHPTKIDHSFPSHGGSHTCQIYEIQISGFRNRRDRSAWTCYLAGSMHYPKKNIFFLMVRGRSPIQGGLLKALEPRDMTY